MSEAGLLENVFAASSLGGLFHSRPFFELHAGDAGRFFQWQIDGRVVACVHFTPVGDGLWRSPARGTYAGFVTEPGLRPEVLFTFHDAVLDRLASLGATRVEVLPAPMAHDAVCFANQFYFLHARGYASTQCDLNHSLEVDARPLRDRMSYGNVKRLRKCEKEGAQTAALPAQALPVVYETLSLNRASKGHTMSMTLAQLEDMQQRFPEAMHLFGCSIGQELAAAALCLRVKADVLYVFYWGDRPGYASLSPVVCVAEVVHDFCQEEGIRLLDVGTSTLDRHPNHGLIHFKRGLGFVESLKVRMARDL